MAALMPQGKQQYFTAGGIPLVGGKVYTYAAGTTTPLATYTDAAAGTPNTNPVILDSRGEASIFFSAVNYKIVVKDSLDSTIWTQDNLAGDAAGKLRTDLAASTGSANVGHIASGTGVVATTVQTKLRESVSVKDFGATGDGVTDDYIAINRAAAYVSSLGGGEVFYPAGTYLVSRAIRLDDFNVETNTYTGNVRYDVTHRGAGRDSTTIKVKSGGFYACIFSSFPEPFMAASVPDAIPGNLMASGVVIKEMTLDCNYDSVVDGGAAYGANYATSTPAVSGWPNGFVGPSYWAADNYQYPIYFYYAEGLQVTNCRIKNSWYNGIEVYASARVQINNNFIDHCGDKANFLGYYSGAQFDQRSNTVSCTSNIIQNCGNGVMSVCGSGATSAVSDVVVADNIFYNIGPGNGVYATDFIESWNVTGNVFDTLDNQGIVFANNQLGWPADQLPKNCIIADNIINEFNLANGTSAAGIRFVGHNFLISNNHIEQTNGGVTADTFGIVTSDGGVTVSSNEAKGGSIVGNNIEGKFPGASSSIGLIYVDTENTLVSSNTLKSTASVAQSAIALLSDNTVVNGNNIVGSYVYGRPIYAVAGSTNLSIHDARYTNEVAIHTESGAGGLSGTATVPFGTVTTVVDTDTFASYGAGGNVFSPAIAGIYDISGYIRITPASASSIAFRIMNGATLISVSAVNAAAGETITVHTQRTIALAAGNSVSLQVNVSAGNFTIESYSGFNMRFIRRTT